MMNPAIATLVNAFNTSDRQPDFNYVDWMLRLDGVLTDRIQWQASAAQKHRAPSYTELFVWFPLGISGGMADGRNYIGNLNLREEQANKLDIGITYRGEGIQISPRLFYDDIKDYIVGSPSQNMTANMVATMMTGQPPLQWQNTDVRLFGMDLLVSAKLSEEWQLNASGQYVRADRQDINEPLFRIAPASLLTQLQWQRNALSASVESLLVARQDEVSALVNESASAGYGVVNLLGRYQVSPQLSLALRINNLLDKFYQPHLNGVNRVASDALPRGEALPEPGRNWVLSLSAQF
jgi:iron complex outermembrane receptor protein